ncbi:SIMPL domain-containing protein [Leptolyngbya sp. FACHB-711]|uniref:SIMPL domain-containing protein n=1 Tax=unclassified Leptolyngbya TaxID=2650499 RepID=UPI001686173F|nr:SIMPL domain-containing protein [Leptolyngbya sp. FACHB-711]MBD1852493.1 SIMPL domain-containing protein [Cyanobacteria bacterium FACHB-502]MBD2024172.1 SIMPL domain-containing protein [Leptolyngbya sp. FACHB-711]
MSKITSRLSRRTLGIAVPLLLGVASISLTLPVLAHETQPMTRTITVTGQGTESIATTLTQVQLGVEVQGRTAEEVQQEAARRSSAVVEFLRGRNVSKLQTTGINLSPRYDYDNGNQRIVGYTATNTVSFRIPTERAGTLLDEAVRAGATRIDSVSFIAEDAAIATARQQAIREATQDAQTQADAALSALGLSREEVVSIQINNAFMQPPPMPLYRQNVAMGAADSAPTPVVGGEQDIQATVTLQIRY